MANPASFVDEVEALVTKAGAYGLIKRSGHTPCALLVGPATSASTSRTPEGGAMKAGMVRIAATVTGALCLVAALGAPKKW